MRVIKEAMKKLLDGKPVLIYDDRRRENEVDMVFYAPKVTPKHVAMMRNLAGGLICYVMPRSVGEILGLKYMEDILRSSGYEELSRKRLKYGDPPNFSLWVNHVDVETGIRDTDRAKTIRELDKVVELVLEGEVEKARRKFYEEFVSPGHVPILLGRSLNERKGHTELSIALTQLVGLRPSLVIVEMLKEGGALDVDEARKIALRLNTILIEGSAIINEWSKLMTSRSVKGDGSSRLSYRESHQPFIL